MLGAMQSAVTEMALRYRECFGEVFRFQIINGTLWVDHISERHDGWYPSRMGAGARPGPLAKTLWMPANALAKV